jgi:tyrosyl-tRNA synthetase
MYGKTLSIPDGAMAEWYSRLLDRPVPEGMGPRDAKRALARALVERFHGAQAARRAEEHFDRVFVAREVPADVEEAPFSAANGSVHLPALIADAFGGSRSEARRMLAQGGVKLDGDPLGPDEQDVAADRLDGAVLQVGKRRFRRLRRVG